MIMKSIGKALGKEIARILVILAVIAAVVFYLKGMAQEKYQKKVAKYASQDLEKLLNLKSDDKISVKINVSDLKFENIDPKE